MRKAAKQRRLGDLSTASASSGGRLEAKRRETEASARLLKWSNRAQIFTAVAAWIGLPLLILWQLPEARNNARLANAVQVYISYMNSGMQHPQFLTPTIEEYEQIKTKGVEFSRYRWFVLTMLFAYDEVFEAIRIRSFIVDYIGGETEDYKQGWEYAFKDDVKNHLVFLCEQKEKGTDELNAYTSGTRERVKAVLRKVADNDKLMLRKIQNCLELYEVSRIPR